MVTGVLVGRLDLLLDTFGVLVGRLNLLLDTFGCSFEPDQNDKDSIAVKQFWNEYKILDAENTLKLVEKQTCKWQFLISDDDVSDVNSYLSVFNTISKKETEWKLKNGKLVTEILAEGTMKTMEASKTNTKRPKAFYNNVIRLGLSYIVDLTSEFEIGMHTFFGEEWDDLKTKVYGQLNLTPLHFEGIILETIKAIEEMCTIYKYWEARELILDKMKNQSASVNLDMFLQNPYVFICEDGQKRKLTEMEYVLKVVAPILDVVFSNVSSMINLRTKCRKIDLRIECRVQGMEVVELSHSSAAPSAMPAKTVRDRSNVIEPINAYLMNY
ncbi:12386_t:CDS:2 [Entrophospora sp. SA101]|nr:12386_t:CDS:2 [Entrophospora sp. SA101]